jgi:hypothetical protein
LHEQQDHHASNVGEGERGDGTGFRQKLSLRQERRADRNLLFREDRDVDGGALRPPVLKGQDKVNGVRSTAFRRHLETRLTSSCRAAGVYQIGHDAVVRGPEES